MVKIEITELELFARGMTAEIYALSDDKLVKLFYEAVPLDVIENEYNVNKIVASYDVRVPAVYDLVSCGTRRGIVFERLQNRTFSEIVATDNSKYEEIAITFAREQAKLHTIVDSRHELKSLKDSVTKALNNKQGLSEHHLISLRELLLSLPDGDRICHGDFNPSNILLSNDEIYLIDWSWTLRGSPAADVAGSFVVITVIGAEIIKLITAGNTPVSAFETRFTELYLDEYIRLTGVKKEDIEKWIPIRAALFYGIGMPPPIDERLLGIIEKAHK